MTEVSVETCFANLRVLSFSLKFCLSIPRLELNAATLAVKLDPMFRKELELPITSSVFWTDSTCFLRYFCNNDKRFHTFVSNRLTVIHVGLSVDQWRHLDSKRYPSDVTTRGLSAKALLSDGKWKQGPEFLWLEESSWPRFPASLETSSPEGLEIKEHKRVYSVQLKNLAQPDDKVFAYYSKICGLFVALQGLVGKQSSQQV